MQRAIPIAAAVLAVAFGLTDFFRNIELQTCDLRVAATARPSAPASHIALIAIDNESLRRMEPLVGRWPWPRLVHATAIDYLAAAGAKVIGYDVLLPERDIRKFMVADTEWTGEESDAALIESTRRAGNVVHIADASSPELLEPERALDVTVNAPAFNARVPDIGCVEPRPVLTPPFPALSLVTRLGHSLFPLDADGPLRRVSPVVKVADRAVPSFALATAIASGATPSIAARIDHTGNCTVMIPWRGPAQGTFTSYGFYDVFYSQQQILEGQKPGIDPSLFKDRIAIVDATAEGLKDIFTTPFPGDISGPEVHANIVDAFLANRSINPSPAWVTVALVITAAAIVGIAGAVLNAWWTGAVVAMAAALFAWQSVALFARGTWIPMTVHCRGSLFAEHTHQIGRAAGPRLLPERLGNRLLRPGDTHGA